ncbi:MAG: hypothetical protein JF609_10870 [Verrucomicrobia bacterium]|nr:hypothetical protein [Verrucomicrobiota bacterium]
MNDWKAIPTIVLVTVLIFGAGVFTGGLLVNEVQKSHPKPQRKVAATPEARPAATNSLASTNEPPKPRPPEILSKRFLQQLDGELNLKPAQREAIQKIIDDGQNQMRKTMQDARLEIREVLTPEQRVQFDDLVKRPFHKPIFNTNAPTALVPTNTPAGAAPNTP